MSGKYGFNFNSNSNNKAAQMNNPFLTNNQIVKSVVFSQIGKLSTKKPKKSIHSKMIFSSIAPQYWKTWEEMTQQERIDSMFPLETEEEKQEQMGQIQELVKEQE